MSTSFSANQYENAFESKKLCNWEDPSLHREHPRSKDGFTQIIANDRGHLTSGVSRSRANPWGDFVGTWDLPKQIPGNRTKVPTARTTYAQEKLMRESSKAVEGMNGADKNANRRVVRQDIGGDGTDGRRSGAEAPGSKMLSGTCRDTSLPASTSPALRAGSAPRSAPRSAQRKSASPGVACGCTDAALMDSARSPIPTVPDMPEVLDAIARRSATPAACPPSSALGDDLCAL